MEDIVTNINVIENYIMDSFYKIGVTLNTLKKNYFRNPTKQKDVQCKYKQTLINKQKQKQNYVFDTIIITQTQTTS